MTNAVSLIDIEMRFAQTQAVKRMSLDVRAGEFFSILGPSGCGKTTLLRMISGFLAPTAGRVLFSGVDMTGVPANRRPTAMIFQSLALFPLMTVWENIAFGLEARGVPKAERRKAAERLLDLIALPGYGDRLPHELSGGQRQRVAVARALAIEPEVLLLDEPLSALDLKLRQHMRAELRDLQKRTGVTFIYITHDQSEALAMSDRVAVMSAGALQQVGAPLDLYANPQTPFVAEFVGETNVLTGTVVEIAGGFAVLESPHGRFVGRPGAGLRPQMQARLYVRPEALGLNRRDADNTLNVVSDRFDFEGAFATAHGRVAQGANPLAVQVSIPHRQLGDAPGIGEAFIAGFSRQDAIVLGTLDARA
ncbi:ABC transporter ATP-binding protein [Aureimonas sp. Leaf460]|uniref:ABC transporter ATP-binding protein n=1 Tax=unclassified Aureimonas TaxID=2615206 RepID=UPI0006F1CCB0|nr:ABC transporter ATP-binding protein [Aureimonas sp. Leaf427]KQT77051.1 ABC transporter ATP-binding protein [Aureimonas sp. Leaf460]